ncbi:MAG TPA: methionine--tRNA ligase [Pirellulales bacterium]|nr:methionine--tRNA ligase [Pirellulales bacterium]
MPSRRLLVTSALPYANGHIHLGHLVEYLQTDIWVRFQKLRGQRCIYLCADDTHGTAIMIRAQQEGRSEAALIADMREHHIRDFAGFGIEFDHYGSTNSPENRALCGQIWQALRDRGMIREKEVTQLFDPQAGTFLADRFVKGTCPNCKSPDQYGDNCEKCGRTYSPSDLIDPVSTLTGAKPEIRSAAHLFVAIEQQHPFLEDWTQSGAHLQDEVANYLKGHFLGEPLRDWDVSRPAPYFGFEIPDSPGNFWYVWFDAPIGYMASLEQWCARTGEQFADWWPRAGSAAESRGGADSAVEIHHFIGKDITYFHTLFWPAMLRTAGFQLPERVHIHGFLTVGGEKMSKTKGTFIRAANYLKHLNPAYLRYYYASKLGARLDDLDLNLEEFVTKVNSDLVGKVVNLASRTARLVEGHALPLPEGDGATLVAEIAEVGERNIAVAYERCDFAEAMRQIMRCADRANKFVDDHEPWKLKKAGDDANLKQVCATALNLFRQLALYLAPVLPQLAEQAAALLPESDADLGLVAEPAPDEPYTAWERARFPVAFAAVGKFESMLTRIDPKEIAAMIEETKAEFAQAPAAGAAGVGAPPPIADAAGSGTATGASQLDGPEALAAEPLAAQCTIDDFAKVDLRVARVLNAEAIPEAKKLLKLTLTLGGDDRRTVFAGIKSKYKPEELVGRLVVCVANLAPRQMKFGLSEGMVTAAGAGGEEIFLLSPDSGAKPGHRVH